MATWDSCALQASQIDNCGGEGIHGRTQPPVTSLVSRSHLCVWATVFGSLFKIRLAKRAFRSAVIADSDDPHIILFVC